MNNKLVNYKEQSIKEWTEYLQRKDLSNLDKVIYEYWTDFNFKRTGIKVCFNKDELKKWLQQWYEFGGALADRILEILNMTPEEFQATYEVTIISKFDQYTFWEDHNSILYYKMIIINNMLDLHGVESFVKENESEDFSTQTVYEYINAGDIYNTTLIYNYDSHEITMGCSGDFME